MPPNMSPDGLPEGMAELELVPLERLVCKGAFGGGPLNGGGPLKGGFCFHLGLAGGGSEAAPMMMRLLLVAVPCASDVEPIVGDSNSPVKQ